MQIRIDWNTGVSLDDSYLLNDPDDYGVYQIYGSHPIYGHHVLLYIGKAQDQTFGVRLRQHEKWLYNPDSDNVKVYTGRVSSDNPTDKNWDQMIDLAEKLLIYSHQPACNSSNINTAKSIPIETHVLNWGNRGMLLPEVSAFRFFATDEVYFQNHATLSTE